MEDLSTLVYTLWTFNLLVSFLKVIAWIFLGLILFQIKHFLADYPLQGTYQLQKFKPKLSEYFLPLLSHAGIHGLGTFMIGVFLQVGYGVALVAAAFDILVHFIVDRIKASPKLLGRFKALTASQFPTATEEQKKHNKYFWFSLGWDQAMHHCTHYVILFMWLLWLITGIMS